MQNRLTKWFSETPQSHHKTIPIVAYATTKNHQSINDVLDPSYSTIFSRSDMYTTQLEANNEASLQQKPSYSLALAYITTDRDEIPVHI